MKKIKKKRNKNIETKKEHERKEARERECCRLRAGNLWHSWRYDKETGYCHPKSQAFFG